MALQFHPQALERVPTQDATRIKVKIDWLWINRRAVNHFPLGENLAGFYKRRLGKYRIIYTWDENPDSMIVFMVGTRDDIYTQFAG